MASTNQKSAPFAFVTLVTSDYYLPGALVVGTALRDVHPSPPIFPDELDPSEFHTVCLVTPETVDVSTVKLLRRVFDVVIGVEVIEAETEEGLRLLGRPDLSTVLTKLHMFRLTSYRKLIFLDADILPLRPLSHLFRLSSSFAAVPDVGWPDIFNSGFLVLDPSEDKFTAIMNIVRSKGSWDGGDQGVLNEWAGSDWERLSFTYNTTPTAAYTYAPAYKRFGSQISNIHFIGPNKPWSQIPFRKPGAASSTLSPAPTTPSQTFAPPSSYAYPALLDRWFAVYNKCYHSAAATPAFSDSHTPLATPPVEFTVQRYESAWDSDTRPSDGAELSGVGAPLGLEELRRLAVEGDGGSKAGDDEGAYHSLPLEGRVDLMRPSKPQLSAKKPAPIVQIQVPEGPHTPTRSLAPMTTLPTPGPNELPPTPLFRGHSLPPETPTHARAPSRSLESEYLHVPDSSPHPASPVRPVSPQSPVSPSRHTSPPLLVWNPAVEAPPAVPPPALHFPEKTYFPNVWDAAGKAQHAPRESGGFFPLPPQVSIPERLVKEGHYSAVIGESRQDEPQHESHAHEEHQDPQHHEQPRPQPHQQHEHHPLEAKPDPAPAPYPRPDRSKIGPVFPWEEKPRHPPDRFFPPTDSPPPGQPYVAPELPAPKLDVRSPHPGSSQLVSPPLEQGFPRTTSYANAWDAVPSIQRYASRLVQPALVPASLSLDLTAGLGRPRNGSAATAGGGEYRTWEDCVEASSRDADDEDEGDDEDEDPSPPGAGVGLVWSNGLGEQLPRGEKKYKVKGVQTAPREMRHQAVQVDGNGQAATRSASGNNAGKPSYGPEGEKAGYATRLSPPKFNRGLPREMKVFEQMAIASPASNAPGFMLPPEQQPAAEDKDRPRPAGALSTRGHDTYTPSTASTVKSPTLQELSPPAGSRIAAASAASQAVSAPSSLGANAPPEGAPIPLAPQSTTSMPRPVGRTFDPARGVDVIKKRSEEVLAKFLRMGSWEDDSPPAAA